MRSIVTGGAGFIGSHLVDRLIKLGHEVVVIDNESAKENNNFFWNNDASNYKYDIRHYKKIEPLFNLVDYVFHLAFVTNIPNSVEHPLETTTDNIVMTAYFLDLSTKAKVKKFLLASTCSNYGISDPKTFATEKSKLNPVSLYAETKIDCERFLKSISDDKFAGVSKKKSKQIVVA